MKREEPFELEESLRPSAWKITVITEVVGHFGHKDFGEVANAGKPSSSPPQTPATINVWSGEAEHGEDHEGS